MYIFACHECRVVSYLPTPHFNVIFTDASIHCINLFDIYIEKQKISVGCKINCILNQWNIVK